MPDRFDTLVMAGRLVDPETGTDRVTDIGIKDGQVTAVGYLSASDGIRVIDASGKIVCAGFIDLHAHGQNVSSDWMQVFDGVTTALELEMGALPVGAWYDRQAQQGRVLNYGAAAAWIFARKNVLAGVELDPSLHAIEMMGAGTAATNWVTDPASSEEIERIIAQLKDGLREGAIGIGLPNAYAAGAGVIELTQVCQLAATYDVPTFSHVPFMSNVDPRSSEESYIRLIGYAGATGAHMHVCHLNSTSLLDVERCATLLRKAQLMGLRISVEAYPYGTGSTVVSAPFFSDPDFTTRTGSTYRHVGLIQEKETFADRSELLSASAANPAALVKWHFLDTERYSTHRDMLDQSVLYPGGSIASDAMPWVQPDGSIYTGEEWPIPASLSSHPRSCGTFTKFLREYVRERKAVSLPEAIAKCTLEPARILEASVPQIRKKARVQEGCDADILVFDFDVVREVATFFEMNRPSEGMENVLIGGVPVIENGRLNTSARPGQALRGALAGSHG